MMQDAHVGSRAHINDSTGVLFSRIDLSGQLGRFLDSSNRFRARAAALDHISCHRSSAVLNELLRKRADEAGRPWTRDVVPLFRRYFVPRYLKTEDEIALLPAREELRRNYGLKLVLPERTQAA